MARLYYDAPRAALKAQTPGRYWCLAETHIQRDPYEAPVSIVVLADPGQSNVGNSIYDQADQLMRDVLKPRHDPEADSNTLPLTYFYDLKGNQRPKP